MYIRLKNSKTINSGSNYYPNDASVFVRISLIIDGHIRRTANAFESRVTPGLRNLYIYLSLSRSNFAKNSPIRKMIFLSNR